MRTDSKKSLRTPTSENVKLGDDFTLVAREETTFDAAEVKAQIYPPPFVSGGIMRHSPGVFLGSLKERQGCHTGGGDFVCRWAITC